MEKKNENLNQDTAKAVLEFCVEMWNSGKEVTEFTEEDFKPLISKLKLEESLLKKLVGAARLTLEKVKPEVIAHLLQVSLSDVERLRCVFKNTYRKAPPLEMLLESLFAERSFQGSSGVIVIKGL